MFSTDSSIDCKVMDADSRLEGNSRRGPLVAEPWSKTYCVRFPIDLVDRRGRLLGGLKTTGVLIAEKLFHWGIITQGSMML